MKNSKLISTSLLNISMIILAFLWLVPILLVLMNASKTNLDFTDGNIWLWPKEFYLFQNIRDVWNGEYINRSFINSLIYASLGSIFSIYIAALAAFGIVILRVKGGFYWFLLIYSGTVFPLQIYLVPIFQAYKTVGLYNTFTGLLLFYTAIAIPFCLFLLRNYLETVSFEIVEAAQIDGSSSFGLFTKIIFPLLWSPMTVLFIFQATWIWNDLMFGLLLTRDDEIRPVMTGLSTIYDKIFITGMTQLLAGILITSIPTVLIFVFLQKYFIKGLQITVKS